MSHDVVIADLKRLLKSRTTDLSTEDYLEHVDGESDRAAMILTASMVEDFLVHMLELRMPYANSDERNRLFSYEGPVGSFSNRIRIAHALGIIDRRQKRAIEIVKELRNAAAHSALKMTFDMPEVKAAIAQIVPRNKIEVADLPRDRLRTLYGSVCAVLVNAMTEKEQARIDRETRLNALDRELSSPDKSSGA